MLSKKCNCAISFVIVPPGKKTGAIMKLISGHQIGQKWSYKYDHLGDTMKDPHWLPISYRIQYKISLLVYKCLNGMGPDYLSNMFHYANYNHLIYLTEPTV